MALDILQKQNKNISLALFRIDMTREKEKVFMKVIKIKKDKQVFKIVEDLI